MHEADASWWDYRSVCCVLSLSQEQKLKTWNYKDKYLFLQIFVKNKVHPSKILLMRKREEKENVMLRENN